MEHKGTVTLETERLILRKFTENDAEAVYRNWACDDEVTKYLTWQAHQSVESSLGYMKFCLEQYESPDAYHWAMVLKGTDEPFGDISVVHLHENVDAAEIGYAIGRKYWGNGYTAEALKAVIEFLFEEVGVNCVSARHDVNNPNSGKVMRKAGMTYEGTLRQSGRNNQGIVDCACYSILRSEYKGK